MSPAGSLKVYGSGRTRDPARSLRFMGPARPEIQQDPMYCEYGRTRDPAGSVRFVVRQDPLGLWVPAGPEISQDPFNLWVPAGPEQNLICCESDRTFAIPIVSKDPKSCRILGNSLVLPDSVVWRLWQEVNSELKICKLELEILLAALMTRS